MQDLTTRRQRMSKPQEVGSGPVQLVVNATLMVLAFWFMAGIFYTLGAGI